jgi:hypothetical protein
MDESIPIRVRGASGLLRNRVRDSKVRIEEHPEAAVGRDLAN